MKIHEGDFIAIMGENGCGKTTLAKHMDGLIAPTAGDIFVGGINTKDKNNHSKITKIVSLTFQNPDDQIITSTVEDEIAFGLENICFPSKKMPEKIEKMLDFVGLKGYEKRSTESLSGGQKQKLLLACVLAVEPKVIVLDEITSMLDPAAQRNVMDILSKINKTSKISIVIITHSIREATFANKIALMKDGAIEVIDRPENIFTNFEIMKNFNIMPLESTILFKKLIDNGYDLNLKNSLNNQSCAKEIMNLIEKIADKN